MTAMAALLQRAPGWPQRLAELICARLARPFEWGPNDCAAFGADAAAALTCADPLAEARAMAQALAQRSPSALRADKRLMNASSQVLADSALTAREWGADGIYGAPLALYPRRDDLLRLATAHSLAEIAQARRVGAHAVLLSPTFATQSHPGAPSLGPVRWRLLAAQAGMPVIALGGMNPRNAHRLNWPYWAAIDGLSELRP